MYTKNDILFNLKERKTRIFHLCCQVGETAYKLTWCFCMKVLHCTGDNDEKYASFSDWLPNWMRFQIFPKWISIQVLLVNRADVSIRNREYVLTLFLKNVLDMCIFDKNVKTYFQLFDHLCVYGVVLVRYIYKVYLFDNPSI